MSSREPGLDEHEWASEMAILEEDLRTNPTEALPQLVDLVGRMLVERGHPPDEPQAQADPERSASSYRRVRSPSISRRARTASSATPPTPSSA